MLSLKEQIKNLETLSQQEFSPEIKQILSKEIKRLKQKLADQEKKQTTKITILTYDKANNQP